MLHFDHNLCKNIFLQRCKGETFQQSYEQFMRNFQQFSIIEQIYMKNFSKENTQDVRKVVQN